MMLYDKLESIMFNDINMFNETNLIKCLVPYLQLHFINITCHTQRQLVLVHVSS